MVDAIARQTGSRADAIEEMTDKKSKDYASVGLAQKIWESWK